MKKLLGKTLAGLGTVLMVVGGLTVAAMIQHSTKRHASTSHWPSTMAITVGTVMGGGGALLRRLGKRLAAARADDVLRLDPRPPVLLLRSFSDDAAGYVSEYRLPGFLSGMHVTGLAASMEPIGFEEMVAEEFGAAGPVVAIGRPGERLPPVGAARTWVSHEEWQARIQDFLDRCRFAVMIIGVIKGKDGLAWELKQIVDTLAIEQIVFIMPPVDEYEARSRWSPFHYLSGGRLPPWHPGTLAVGFAPDGRCAVLCGEGERFQMGKDYRQALKQLIAGKADYREVAPEPAAAPLRVSADGRPAGQASGTAGTSRTPQLFAVAVWAVGAVGAVACFGLSDDVCGLITFSGLFLSISLTASLASSIRAAKRYQSYGTCPPGRVLADGQVICRNVTAVLDSPRKEKMDAAMAGGKLIMPEGSFLSPETEYTLELPTISARIRLLGLPQANEGVAVVGFYVVDNKEAETGPPPTNEDSQRSD